MQKSLKESAQEYEPAKTKNIADLETVPIDAIVVERIFKEGTADEFRINVIVIDSEDYRVPDSVLNNLKALIEDDEKITHFKVLKSGEGLKTSYTVVPLNK